MIYESPSLRLALEDQIATLWIDAAGQTENRLSLELLDDLERALRAAQQLPSLDLLAIRSAKPSGFSPGYDFQQMSGLQTTEECSAFAGRGQQLTQLLSKLGPNLLTIAIVEGKCRSAGLELVLACDYRVALIRSDTCLGFPENKLGLMPCWGGTLRLPQMIGRRRALAMLLRGVEFSAVEALNAGLVDAAFDERSFRIELQSFLERLQDSPRKLSTPRSWRERLYDANPIGRWLTSRRAKKWVTDIDAEERPAAQAIIQAVNVGYSSPVEGPGRGATFPRPSRGDTGVPAFAGSCSTRGANTANLSRTDQSHRTGAGTYWHRWFRRIGRRTRSLAHGEWSTRRLARSE